MTTTSSKTTTTAPAAATRRIGNEHVFHTVQTPAERTAAYKWGVNVGEGRFWFTRGNWNSFVDETKGKEE